MFEYASKSKSTAARRFSNRTKSFKEKKPVASVESSMFNISVQRNSLAAILSDNKASASKVIQGGTIQRQHLVDTGWRYNPPKKLNRSIKEIQGIVGATSDGEYGRTTKYFVEKYQRKLKAEKYYNDAIDGKWGMHTDAAHESFAINEAKSLAKYNCSGFSFKTYKFILEKDTQKIFDKMTRLPNCSAKCPNFYHKFWFWQFIAFDYFIYSGFHTRPHKDFHVVGGQTDKNGYGPKTVMSKNGDRSVEGPKPPDNWKPKSGPAQNHVTGKFSKRVVTIVKNLSQKCYCSAKLP